jgi:predicted PurR-regulated permease PerM
MVGIVLVVHLLVGNVLYPLLFGKAASVHPIVILLAIGVGGIVGGALGALLGVPILMATRAFVEGLRRSGMGPTTEIRISGIGES